MAEGVQQKPRRFRGLVLAAAALVGLVVVLQLIFWSGMLWLNSAGGEAWLGAQLNAALKESGYSVTARGVKLSVLGTVTVDKLDLGDDTGSFLTGDNVALHISPAALAAHHLSGSLSADAIDLRRLPSSADTNDGEAPAGAALPALFIRSAHLALGIKRLVLPEDMLGADAVLAPQLVLDAALDGNTVQFTAALRQTAENRQLALFTVLPAALNAKGTFDAATLRLHLDSFDATAPAYAITAKGDAAINSAAPLDITLQARNDDLAALTAAKLAGAASLDLHVTGSRDAPILAAKGALQKLLLNGRNLDDVTFEAQSDKPPAGHIQLATRYLDRPVTFDTGFDWQGGVLHLEDIQGTAPDITMTGGGSFDTGSLLAEGTLALRGDLAAYRDLLKSDIAGKAEVTLTAKANGERQSADIAATLAEGRYDGMSIGQAAVRFSMADVSLLWPDNAEVTLSNLKSSDFQLTTMSARLNRAEDHYALQLDGKMQAPSAVAFSGSANLSGTSLSDAAARDISLKVTQNKGSAVLAGAVLPDKLDVNVKTQSMPLAALPMDLPAALAGLTATGALSLEGDPAAPKAAADIALSPLKAARGAPAVALKLKAAYGEGALTASLAGSGRGIRDLGGQLSLPLHLSLKPLALDVPGTTKLDGAGHVNGDLAALAGAFLPPDIRLRGNIAADMRVAGTLARPDTSGRFTLSNTRLDQLSTGLTLRDLALNGTLAGDRLQITSLTATDGRKGKISGKGSLQLGGTGAAQGSLSLAHMDFLRHNEEVNGTLSADIDVTGNAKGYTLKGRVNPDDIYVNIPERFTSTVPKLNVIDPRKKRAKESDMLSLVALNLVVRGNDRIFVRGWGLDAEFGGSLDVGGTAAAPLVNGTLESKRGRYEEFGKRFTIDHAILRFQGTVPPSPYLDVLAETTAADITAQVALTGPVAKPAIAFTSVPALPQDEVLAHILFGKGMDKISPFQAIQLTRTLQRFSGKGGGPDPLGAFRSAARLDDLNVQTDDSGATTVGAGKYVTDKVYLEVDSGSDKKSGAAKVQMELTPKVKLESKIGQDAQTGAGITWGFDY